MPGELRPQSATRWGRRGHRVTNSHVIHHDFGYRKRQARRSMEQTCDDLALLVLAAVALLAGLTFRDYGIGLGRLQPHAEYADLLLRMYGSGFRGHRRACPFANLYMYGGGFGHGGRAPCTRSFRSSCSRRAACSAPSSAVGRSCGDVAARPPGRRDRLRDWPRCSCSRSARPSTAHMFMNPKDAPFAVAMIILMLGLVRLAEEISAAHASDHSDRRHRAPDFRSVPASLGGLALVYAGGRLHAAVPRGVPQPRARARHPVASSTSSMCCCPALVVGYLIMGPDLGRGRSSSSTIPSPRLTYFSHFFEKPWKEMFDGALVSVPDMAHGRICRRCFALQLPEVLLALLAVGRRRHFRAVCRAREVAGKAARPSCLMLTFRRLRCRFAIADGEAACASITASGTSFS